MYIYFLFQSTCVCVQLANVFTRNLFFSMSDIYQWWPSREEIWEREWEKRGRKSEREKKCGGEEEQEDIYLFVSFSYRRKEKENDDCPFIPLLTVKKENYIEVHWNRWVARCVRDKNDHLHLSSSSVSTMIYVLWIVIVLTEHIHIYVHIHIHNVRRAFSLVTLHARCC